MDGIFQRNGKFKRASKNEIAPFGHGKSIHGWQSKWIRSSGIRFRYETILNQFKTSF